MLGLQAAARAGCKALRLMVCGSAALPMSVLTSWEGIGGSVLLERYGMTEFAMALSNPLEEAERLPVSSGKLIAGIWLRPVRPLQSLLPHRATSAHRCPPSRSPSAPPPRTRTAAAAVPSRTARTARWRRARRESCGCAASASSGST